MPITTHVYSSYKDGRYKEMQAPHRNIHEAIDQLDQDLIHVANDDKAQAWLEVDGKKQSLSDVIEMRKRLGR